MPVPTCLQSSPLHGTPGLWEKPLLSRHVSKITKYHRWLKNHSTNSRTWCRDERSQISEHFPEGIVAWHVSVFLKISHSGHQIGENLTHSEHCWQQLFPLFLKFVHSNIYPTKKDFKAWFKYQSQVQFLRLKASSILKRLRAAFFSSLKFNH